MNALPPAVSRLKDVQDQIRIAAHSAGREVGEVHLIAVSKTFDVEDILPVIAAGQRRFGENRVQEAKSKWPQLRNRYPDLELHLIGPLQTNKAADAVHLFDVIQTVDRPKLAVALASEMRKQGVQREVFIQVNTGQEPQKAGISPEDAPQFHAFCRDEARLRVVGLMCIPPADEDPQPHFALLQSLAEAEKLHQLSMGMSGDFATAIACGATHVRVGSAIFGVRNRPAG
jgi:hypothetical protein